MQSRIIIGSRCTWVRTRAHECTRLSRSQFTHASCRRARLCIPDELPLWGMVGELSASEESHHAHPVASKVLSSTANTARDAAPAYIYTHKSFSISYNRDQIIQVCARDYSLCLHACSRNM